jgi:hypothetical protein
MFKNRELVIATKHHKEKVIAPLLEKELGVKCIVVKNFDTDQFGTFTGEIARAEDAITTARKKCIAAMEHNHCSLGIASEGSFGPHPSIPFLNADDELLVFIDKENDLEICVRELSTKSNFSGEEIKTENELIRFAENTKFPSHGLIIRKTKDDYSDIKKGITNLQELKKHFQSFMNLYGIVYLETDMRAMYNPTRMIVIEDGTKKLIEKIKSCCPVCNTPGYAIDKIVQGLKCEYCHSPTRSTLAHLYMCIKCSFSEEKKYPHQKLFEEQLYCDVCNP